MSDEYNVLMELVKSVDRIAEALEEMINIQKRTAQTFLKRTELEGEKSVSLGENKLVDSPNLTSQADSKPLPQVVQTQNFVDVRECFAYSEKSYKLRGYDNKYCYIAKQHVVRTEAIEGGGTRVIVGIKSAWVIEKLEWKSQ